MFLFVFVPVMLAGYFALGRTRWIMLPAAYAALGSLVFYGWERPYRLLPIIAGSMLFNWIMGRSLAGRPRKWLLQLGVAGNLVLLGVFKYLGFVAANVALLGLALPLPDIALPLGISFYTFTQIAYLVDAYRGQVREHGIVRYVLFVTYFPHLIAGPILHHSEMMPQFARRQTYRLNPASLMQGLAWFSLGIAKKTMLADTAALYAEQVFGAASTVSAMSATDAWLGAGLYAMQIYFDFSGYCDMAVGLALMMNIRLPLNFWSPYKATSMIEFWRRWHMTLSRFLRDYLYITLGGSRKGEPRRYANLMVTMLLGGLWHGASWNFVLWGGLHGAGLAVNHLWRRARPAALPPIAGQALTLLLVVVAWVPFRAAGLQAASLMWSGMMGRGGQAQPVIADPFIAFALLATLSAIALLAPNTAEIIRNEGRAGRIAWRSTLGWALACGLCLGVGIGRSFGTPTAFLYFQF